MDVTDKFSTAIVVLSVNKGNKLVRKILFDETRGNYGGSVGVRLNF